MPTFRGGLSSMSFTWSLTGWVYRVAKHPLMISEGTFRLFSVSGKLHVGLVLVAVSWEKHPPASFTGQGFPAESCVKRYNQVLASFSSQLTCLLCYLYFQAASWYLLAVSDLHSVVFSTGRQFSLAQTGSRAYFQISPGLPDWVGLDRVSTKPRCGYQGKRQQRQVRMESDDVELETL